MKKYIIKNEKLNYEYENGEFEYKSSNDFEIELYEDLEIAKTEFNKLNTSVLLDSYNDYIISELNLYEIDLDESELDEINFEDLKELDNKSFDLDILELAKKYDTLSISHEENFDAVVSWLKNKIESNIKFLKEDDEDLYEEEIKELKEDFNLVSQYEKDEREKKI